MNFIYILKVSTITAALWLIYKLLLRKDTFFGIKRLYFIAGMFIAFLLPLWHLKKIIPVDTTSISIPINNLMSGNLQEINLQQGIDLNNLLYVMLVGTVFFIVKMLLDITGIYRLLTSGTKAQKNGYILVKVDKDITPFSFGKYVVVNPKQFSANELQMVLAHELVHIRQKHSIDVILSGIFTALQWYNPFAWFWRNDLIENLEFIADKQTTKQIKSIKNYQYLLLKTGLINPLPALVNNFYKPNLKNRIMMLQKKQTQSIQLVKFGILLPLIVLFLYGFNTEKVYAQNTKTLYVIDKNTSSKQLKDIENKLNKEAKKFSIHFDDIMYLDDVLVNIDVSTHYFTTGKDAKFRIQNKKGILKTVFYIDAGKLVITQTKNKMFSIYDDGVALSTFDNDSKASTTSTVQVKHYDKDGKETKKNTNTGTITYKDKNYFYVKTGNNYHFFDRFGSETNSKTAKTLQNQLTSGQIFIIDASTTDLKKNPPLYVLNGKIITNEKVKKLTPDNIRKIKVIKGDAAIKKYGDKGKHGVVELFTK